MRFGQRPRFGRQRDAHTYLAFANWRGPHTISGVAGGKSKPMKYIIVHGGWHCGALLEQTAAPIRDAGHEVQLPTLLGNDDGDDKTIGLSEVINALRDYFERRAIEDAVLVGHSYAGVIITALADQIPQQIRRLVYWNAFVPLPGESLNDLLPPHYVELFENLATDDGSVMLPFPIWRDALS